MRVTGSSRKALWLIGISLFCLLFANTAALAVDWVLLIDNTGTMRYGDRGEMTLEGIREFISRTEDGDRVSILSYGEQVAYVLRDSPVTVADDASRDRVASSLSFAFDADRTDITAGLDRVWADKLALFPGSGGNRQTASIVVLLTDGKLIPVYDDYSRYEEIYGASRRRLLEVASLLGEQGTRVCTIALGRGEKVDRELMEEVASRSGGSSHHVETPQEVIDAFTTISSEQRPSPLVEGPDAPLEERGSDGLFSIQEVAYGDETPRDSGGTTRSRPSLVNSLSAFPDDLCLASAGVLAIFIGLVAVGSEKRQRWAWKLSGALFGTGQRRVRGYLKPIDPRGHSTARANIGLENPGTESVRLGNGTPCLPQLEATVEFIGTTDRTAPTMVVEGGTVTVEGKPVVKRKLRDGDIVDLEGLRYQYLRGNRR
jgi:Mg-chelatase subunit ChlD